MNAEDLEQYIALHQHIALPEVAERVANARARLNELDAQRAQELVRQVSRAGRGMSAHTLGRWSVVDDGLKPITVIGEIDCDDDGRPTAPLVCELSDSPEDCGLANARLIAAAPELLTDLRKAADTFADMAKAMEILGLPIAAESARIADRACRKTIAKAEAA